MRSAQLQLPPAGRPARRRRQIAAILLPLVGGIQLIVTHAHEFTLRNPQKFAGFAVSFENQAALGVDHENRVARRVDEIVVLLLGVANLLKHGSR